MMTLAGQDFAAWTARRDVILTTSWVPAEAWDFIKQF
jgi:hypothetical protein